MKPIQFLLAKINEAYFIEHNLPCERHFTHDELVDAFTEVRAAHLKLYGQPPAAEACTDPDFSTAKGVEP